MIIDFFNEILNFSLTGPGLWDEEKEESPCPTRSHGNSCRKRDEGETQYRGVLTRSEIF
jgi:hypothetical protein